MSDPYLEAVVEYDNSGDFGWLSVEGNDDHAIAVMLPVGKYLIVDASEPLWVQKWQCADERGCTELATLLVRYEDERMPVCHAHYDVDDELVGLAFESVVVSNG